MKWILIFAAAAVLGIFANQVIWPYFVERPLFYEYNLEQSPIYVTEKQQTIIQENQALKEAVEKIGKTVIAIKSTTPKGVVTEVSGLILTSDGLAVALSDQVPANTATEINVEGQKTAFQILKRDKDSNLVLIKLEKNNLPTSSFFPLDGLKLGERVFLLGLNSTRVFANEGIVRSFNADRIETSIIESAEAQGSPVYDIQGNILGLAFVGKDGKTGVIPISKIKTFSGL